MNYYKVLEKGMNMIMLNQPALKYKEVETAAFNFKPELF